MVATRSKDTPAKGGAATGGGGGGARPSSGRSTRSTSSAAAAASSAAVAAGGGQGAFDNVKAYVERVKELEKENRDLRAQVRSAQQQEQGGGGKKGAAAAASAASAASASDGGAAAATAAAEEIRALKREKEKLESKLEAQEKRYKEEAARVKAEYKKQGLTYGNERAAKASQNAEAEKAYLKDQLQLKESQAKEAREELKKAQAAVKQLEKEKRLAQSALVNQEHDTEREVEELGGALETAEAELARTKEALKRAEEARDRAQQRVQEGAAGAAGGGAAAAAAAAARMEALEGENRRLRVALEEARRGQEQLLLQQRRQEGGDDEELQALRDEVRGLKRELEELEGGQTEEKRQLKVAQQRLEALQREYDQLAITAQSAQDRGDAEERGRTAAEAALAPLRREVARAEGEVGPLRRALARAEGEAAGLKEENARLKGQVDALQEQAQAQARAARRESAASVASGFGGGEVERLRSELQTYRDMLRSQEQGFSLVYLKEVNEPKRYLVVGNGTNLDVSLAGWSLQARSNPEVSFDLPDEAGIGAHGSLTVWWGGEGDAAQYKARPNARNIYWEESDVVDIFRASGDEVVLLDAEGREMSHLKVILNAHRRVREPGAGSPSPDAKRPRSSLAGAGSGVRTPFRL